jgi:uncharacterized protein (DUF1778 family)
VDRRRIEHPAARYPIRPPAADPDHPDRAAADRRRVSPAGRSAARSEQKRLLPRAAEIRGQTLTEFVVAAAQEAATRAIVDQEVIELSVRDSRAFAEGARRNRRLPAAINAKGRQPTSHM